jgi:putative endonuclease
VYFCYILKSLRDLRFYYGYTSNLEERLKKHNSGGVTSTKYRLPVILHYFEAFDSKTEALKREKFFKSFDGRKWLLENKII